MSGQDRQRLGRAELRTRQPRFAPIVGLSLDRWITLGRRTLYRNQDYERGSLHPWIIEADEEWFYLYYSTGQQSLGLIRAPKRSVYQPIVLWERQTVEPGGLQSKILEPDRLPFTLHLTSDQDGELRLVAWNPAVEEWLELAPRPFMRPSYAPSPHYHRTRDSE